MKYSLFFVFIFIQLFSPYSTSLFAQKTTLKSTDSISAYFNLTESDTIPEIKKLENINHFLKGAFLYKKDSLIYKGLMRKTKILNKLKKRDSAIYYSEFLYDYAKENKNLIFQQKALTKLGIYHKNKNQLAKAFSYHNKAFKISRTTNDSLEAGKSLLYMANIQKSLGDHIGSKITATDGLRHIESTSETKRISGLLLNISVAYKEQKNFDKALEYNTKALSLEKESLLIEKIGKSTFLKLKSAKANILALHGKFNESIDILSKLLLDSIVINDQKEYARVISNLGYTKWLENPNNTSSDSLLQKALTIRKNKKDTQGLIASNIHLTKYYLDTDKEKALTYAEGAYLKAKKRNSRTAILEALGFIFDLKENITEEAKIYHTVNEEIKSINQSNRDLYADTKYENEKLEKENAEKDKQVLKTRNQNIIYISISIVLLLLAGFITYLLNRRNKDLKQKAVKLKQQNKIDKLETSYKERIQFSKKIHDSFAAKLYGIMMSIKNGIDTSKILDQIDDVYNQSRNFSRENSEIDTGENYKNELSEMLRSYTPPTTQSYIKGLASINWSALSALDKIALFTTLQELMINMKKHSQTDVVTVTFSKDKDYLKVNYFDNGKGASVTEMNKKNGLKNTESRIQAINGTIKFDTEKGDGFKAEIRIPN
ncbi:hypothetical protein [uncultured Aquimarina sp.]|uniref:tetratricopeptide repeat-containing sensor histidine kinase n=1 Tax=uncultured Aquimarina sp. TaxID=575652 RepID=UPI0026277661|nr:hypothetical protein [uncultured Aquimarina sp.]